MKTVYASGYTTIEKEPRPEHLLQLYLYMCFEKVKKGILLYIGRDNGFMVEYTYDIETLNKLLLNTVKTKMTELINLKAMIENKELPEKDYNIYLKSTPDGFSEKFTKDKIAYKTAWQCSYCQWKNTCHKDVFVNMGNNKFYIDGEYIN